MWNHTGDGGNWKQRSSKEGIEGRREGEWMRKGRLAEARGKGGGGAGGRKGRGGRRWKGAARQHLCSLPPAGKGGTVGQAPRPLLCLPALEELSAQGFPVPRGQRRRLGEAVLAWRPWLPLGHSKLGREAAQGHFSPWEGHLPAALPCKWADLSFPLHICKPVVCLFSPLLLLATRPPRQFSELIPLGFQEMAGATS